MVSSLLVKYREYFQQASVKSEECIENERLFIHFNFYYAEKFLRIGIFLWLAYQLFVFHTLQERPIELFDPMSVFGKLFMPHFPSIFIIYTIASIAAITNFLCLFYKGNILQKSILAFCILYLNTLMWNYGFLSHVGHLFVLVNLFIIFIDIQYPNRELLKNGTIGSSIKWAYTGFMLTYTIAGTWKVIGLLVRFTLKKEGISWLSEGAALSNAVAGFKSWDLPLDSILIDVFKIPFIWEISFIGMLTLQLISAIATFRQPLYFPVGLGTIVFHLFNLVFMKIVFIVTPLLLFVLFFPYHKVFGKKYEALLNIPNKLTFSGKGKSAVYCRYYEIGKDEYTGFYAYREKWWDNGKWYAFILFIPGVSLVLTLILSLMPKEEAEPAQLDF